MLHNPFLYSRKQRYAPCFLAETAESCAHQPSGCHCACMCNLVSYSKQWNLLRVNKKNELLTVGKRRIAPASDLWRRCSAGSLPCDDHTRTVREAKQDKHNAPSNLQVGRERASSRTQQNYTLQLHINSNGESSRSTSVKITHSDYFRTRL